MNKNLKSINFSSRISEEVYNVLVDDATKSGISLNSLANNILKHHTTWKRYSEKMGFMPISKKLLADIFINLTDKQVVKFGKEISAVVIVDFLFLNFNKIDYQKLMKGLEINAESFGNVKYSESEDTNLLNIVHGINRKFSQFLVAAHEEIAEKFSIRIEIKNINETSVCMKFSDPKRKI